MDLLPLTFEAVPKGLVYLAAIVAVGAAAARGLLLARAAGASNAEDRGRDEVSLGRIAVKAATLLVIALVLRAWGHTAASFGIAESFAWPSLSLVAFESAWGQMWQIQLAGAMTLAVVARGIRHVPSLAWPATGVAAVAICYLLPLVGHAAGEPLRVLLHGSHVLGSGLWVGTLAAAALGVPPDRRIPLLRAFAPVALAGAGLLGLTGALAAWLYVGSFTTLVASTYGRLLVVKVIFVAAIGMFGFINWRQFHRRPGTAGGAPVTSSVPSPREAPVVLELLMAAVVIIVTAVLTEVEHP